MFDTATHHRRGSWKFRQNTFLSCSFIDFQSCRRFCGSFLRFSSALSFVMHVLSNATKIYKSLFPVRCDTIFSSSWSTSRTYAQIYCQLPFVFLRAFFFSCRTAPRVPLCSKNLSCISFEIRRRWWRFESVQSSRLIVALLSVVPSLIFMFELPSPVDIVRWSALKENCTIAHITCNSNRSVPIVSASQIAVVNVIRTRCCNRLDRTTPLANMSTKLW